MDIMRNYVPRTKEQLERDVLFAFSQYGHSTGAFIGSLIEEKQATSPLIQQQIRGMMSTLYEIIARLPQHNALVEHFLVEYRTNTIWFSVEFAERLPLILYTLFATFPDYVRETQMATVCATLTYLIHEYNDLNYEKAGAFLRAQNAFVRLIQEIKAMKDREN